MIIAIAPVVVIPVIVALAGIGGLFAFMRKKAGGGMVEPSKDPAGKLIPYIDIVTGTTTARLERKGATYVFEVKGPVPATGGNEDAGTATIEMAQAIAASDSTSAIAGEAGSATNPAITFGVQPNQDLWDWSVTTRDPVPNKVPSIPPKIAMLDQGYRPKRSDAFRDMLSAMSQFLDWLDIPALEGGAAPQPPKQLPGIVIAGNTVAITSLDQWVAYMAPMVREAIATGATADDIMDGVFGESDDWVLNGKPFAEVRERVQDTMDRLRDGGYLNIVAPDERIAAQIVGGAEWVLDKANYFVGRYKKHVILVRPARVQPAAAGGFAVAPPGKRFEYLIWTGGSRGFDEGAVETRVMPADRTKAQTTKFAKQRIEQGLPVGTGDAGGNTGATSNANYGEPDDGGNTGATSNANYGEPLVGPVNAGVFTPPAPLPAELIYSPPTIDVMLPKLTWRQRGPYELTLFDFAIGNNAKYRDWKIAFAVCMTSDNTLGELTEIAEGRGQPWEPQTQFDDPFSRVLIRNVDGVQLSLPLAPPFTNKGRYEAEFERGAVVKITEPMEETSAWSMYDPCPQRDESWPIAESPAGFFVIPAGANPDVYNERWNPAVDYALIVRGPKIILRVTYSGFPYFQVKSGTSAALDPKSEIRLAVKVHARGTN